MSVALSKSLKTELYRKAVHLSSLWMPLLILQAPRNWSVMLFALLLMINLFVEYAAYQKNSFVGTLFRRMFIRTLRGKEICRREFVPSGSIYVLAGALTVSVCFSPLAAAAAMSVMLIADTAAALCGKFFGSVRFANGKSMEGTLAFFACAVLIISFFFPEISPAVSWTAAAMAAAAEFFEGRLKIDDNFSIPLVTGFVLNLI